MPCHWQRYREDTNAAAAAGRKEEDTKMWRIVYEGIWLSAMSISDVRYKRIPIWMIGLGIPAASIAVLRGWNELSIKTSVFCLIPGFLLLLSAFTKRVGYGDGIVLLLLGLMVGRDCCMKIFLISMMLMSLFAAVMLILRKVVKETRLPYLPFLLIAWFVGRLLYG